MEPTTERRQHDRITRDEQQLADTAGLIGHPWRAEGLLARLERHGDISRRERAAGEEFARLFNLAHLDPLRSGDMGRGIVRAPSVTPSNERARHDINKALDVLGGLDSLCGACAWHIIGAEMTIAEFVLRQRSGGVRITPQTGKGVLLATLNMLAAHFRA